LGNARAGDSARLVTPVVVFKILFEGGHLLLFAELFDGLPISRKDRGNGLRSVRFRGGPVSRRQQWV